MGCGIVLIQPEAGEKIRYFPYIGVHVALAMLLVYIVYDFPLRRIRGQYAVGCFVGLMIVLSLTIWYLMTH